MSKQKFVVKIRKMWSDFVLAANLLKRKKKVEMLLKER